MTLLKPLRYVLIRHRAKLLYDFLLPAILAAGVTALLVYSLKPIEVFGREGYLSSLQNLLTIMGGFFVAALTLITTATMPILKEPVGGREPPRLANESAPLSRKRFLAYLFGYLSTSSFLLVAITIVANLAAPDIAARTPQAAHMAVKTVFLGLFNFWLAHVFVATLLGMFYFTERLQMSDGRARIGRPDAAPTAAE